MIFVEEQKWNSQQVASSMLGIDTIQINGCLLLQDPQPGYLETQVNLDSRAEICFKGKKKKKPFSFPRQES